MNPLIIQFAIITFLSTLLGGAIILRFHKSLPYFFAFAAGSLMGVAFLDILPESLTLSHDSGLPLRWVMVTVVFSFFVYSFIERFFLTHPIDEHAHHEHIMGPIGAGSLVLHSFMDGAAIGAAFQVNASVGITVAFAVIFHDFTDGINTVTIMLKNNQPRSKAMLFLLMDALAPVLGVIVISFIALPASALALLLAFFVGEFIYIGASHLLPETKRYPSGKVVLSMALGILVILFLTSFL